MTSDRPVLPPPEVRPIEVRPIEPDEFDRFHAAISGAFGAPVDPAERELDRGLTEEDRTLAAYDGPELVGTTAVVSLELTVPGATRPVAGVTAVGVAPTHRRRGVLTALMTRQLRDIADRGDEPIATLFASEPGIYPRFGYGSAARGLHLTIPRTTARVAAPATGRLRFVETGTDQIESAEAVLGPLFDTVRPVRPGLFRRTTRWWRHRLFDPPSRRGETAPLRCVVHDGPDGPDGYVLYRTTPRWSSDGPGGTVDVVEVIATTAAATVGMWTYLLGLDLMSVVHARVGVDDPLLHLLVDPRAARPQLVDNLWIRVVDVGRALAGRGYAAPADIVLDVDDPLLPGNRRRWRLSADADGARCEPTAAPAELALDVTALGAAYLGGVRLETLAAAGRLHELRAGTLAAASRAFDTVPQPFCPQVF